MSQKLYIVGAAKAGTTSLQEYLAQHPKICFSEIKEPHFFSTDIKVENFREEYKKSLHSNRKTRHQAFIRNKEEYLKLFKSCQANQYSGDASTSYLYSQVAAKAIHEYAPDAKIIILLRDPSERAFSHYAMNRRAGFTELPFLQEVSRDQKQKDRAWGKAHLYIDLGMYYQQVKRYIELFEASQIKLIRFDTFTENTSQIVAEVLHFLDLDQVSLNVEEVHNPKRIPKSRKAIQLIRKLNLVSLVPHKLKLLSRKFLYAQKDEIPQLQASQKAYLNKQYFMEDIVQLETMLQLDLSDWYA